MNAKQSTYKLIIWMLYSFVLFGAVTTLVKALIYLYFHYGLTDGFVDIHFTYYIPAFSIVVALVFCIVLVVFLQKHLTKWYIKKDQFPAVWFLIFLVICLTDPVIKGISNIKISTLYDDLSQFEYLSERNFELLFNILDLSVFGSRWFLCITLLLFYIFKIKRQGEQNSKL